MMAEQLITLGQIDASDTLATTLHNAALDGNRRALKKVLEKGIDVDFPNDEGQSPLFCACLAGRDNVIEYLLDSGADPNEKSNLGLTPVHVACYSGNVKSLMKLLGMGGDLRLHDYQGRGVKDWAMLHPKPKKRMKILEFLDKTRLFAMSHSGQDLLLKRASSHTLNRAQHRQNSITKIIRDRIGRPSVHENLESMASSHHSLGFGQVYANGRERSGFVSAIPLVTENNLRHDTEGETYHNGAFCVMESMWWEYTQVTVKKLHRDVDPYHGGVVDLLINEIEQIGKLRHPNILTLMGVCQTSNLDNLILIYERIDEGSLYNYLHQRMERLPNQVIRDIAVQMCNAVVFIHLRGLVHSGISSHAISVVNGHTFKLSNFEYMVESSKCEMGKKNAIASNTDENSVYNWMAPEIMFNLPPSFYCDMYSYCAVLWELFHGEVPFDSQSAEAIKSLHQKGGSLKIYHGKMADFYKTILEYGLQHDPNNRKLSFLHVRDLLIAAPQDISQYVRAHFQHLQQNDNASSSLHRSNTRQLPTQSVFSTSNPTLPSGPTTSNQVEHAMSSKHEKQRYNNNNRQLTTSSLYTEKKSNNNKEEKSGKKEKFRAVIKREPPKRADRDGRYMRDEDSEEEYEYERRRQVRNSHYNCSLPARTGNQCAPILRDTPQKPARIARYNTDSLRWESKSQKEGDNYRYTVSVQKDQSPKKQTKEINEPKEESKESERETSSTDDYAKVPDTKYAKGMSLQRKTSSMGHFSYLELQHAPSTRSAGAKPACHGQCDPVSEVYSTVGKLTTAGSLYALYNDHSPDLPMGQPEQRPERHPVYTLPRAKKHNTPLKSPDPAWFGGRGSVRDLAKVFQEQIKEHGLYQSVLDGKFNNNCSSEPKQQCDGQVTKSWPLQPADGNQDCSHGSACSLTTVTLSDGDSDSFDPYKITYDLGDDSSSTFTSNSNIKVNSEGDSTDSDLVSKWVDHEIRKIGRKLSREMMTSQTNIQVVTPDLFDRSVNQQESSAGPDVTPSTSEENTLPSYHEAGDQDSNRYALAEHEYFDDEMYGNQLSSNRCPTTNWAERGAPVVSKSARDEREDDSWDFSPLKTALPMKSILIKTAKDDSVYPKREVTEKRMTRNKARISRIPTSSVSKLPRQQSTEVGAYANIVTVKSSLDNSGLHSVTHEMQDLKTGGKKTITANTVTARNVITTFKAAS